MDTKSTGCNNGQVPVGEEPQMRSESEPKVDFDLISGTLSVDYRPIDSLKPYANNARTHSERQIAKIAASIRSFGFVNPILIDATGGVVAGRTKVIALVADVAAWMRRERAAPPNSQRDLAECDQDQTCESENPPPASERRRGVFFCACSGGADEDLFRTGTCRKLIARQHGARSSGG